jgi:hypothetical protein
VVGPFGGGGGGLLGGLLGGLAGAAARGLAETLAAGAAEGAGAAERAAAAIVADARVTAALGRVSVGPPMSQAISSSSVNGVTTRRVSLLLPLLDGAGAVVAQARVDEEEGGRGSSSRSARIVVRAHPLSSVPVYVSPCLGVGGCVFTPCFGWLRAIWVAFASLVNNGCVAAVQRVRSQRTGLTPRLNRVMLLIRR